MNVLVVAVGIEDSRTAAWGVLARSLKASGYRVHCVDPFQMEMLTRDNPDGQIEWIFDNKAVDVVIATNTGHDYEKTILHIAENRGIDIRSIEVEEITMSANSDPSWSLLPVVGDAKEIALTRPRLGLVDILVVGTHTEQRAAIVERLVAEGKTVRIYGQGWASTPYSPFVVSPLAFVLFEAVLASSASVGVWRSTEVGESVGPLYAAAAARRCGLELSILDDSKTPENLSPNDSWADRWSSLLGPARSSVKVKTPKVSYVTAAYNVERYVGEAVDSLTAQTVDDLEIIVVVDGASDSSGDIVHQRARGDARIRVIDQSNIGQTGRFDLVFGAGVDVAQGEFIGILGGDDIAMPNRTELSLDVFAADPLTTVVHGGGIEVDATGVSKNYLFTPTFSYDQTSFLRRAIGCNPVAEPSVLMRRSAIEAVGGYTNGFTYDFDAWMKLSRVAKFRYLPTPLVKYRVHGNNSSLGVGARRAHESAMRVRVSARKHLTIEELYPALLSCQDDSSARGAAYVDLGNLWLMYDPLPEAALVEYERALKCIGDNAIVLANMAVALNSLGETTKAAQYLNRALSLSPTIKTQTTALMSATGISQRPFCLEEGSVTFWDGTGTDCRRILLIGDWQRVDTWHPVVDAYLNSCTSSDAIDLVMPSLGTPPGIIAEEIFKHFGASNRLENGPDITIEDWPVLALIPMDRFSGIIDARTGIQRGQANALINNAKQTPFSGAAN